MQTQGAQSLCPPCSQSTAKRLERYETIPWEQIPALYSAVAGSPVPFRPATASAPGCRSPQVQRFHCKAASLAARGQQQESAGLEKTPDAFQQRDTFFHRKVINVVVERRD